MKYYVAFLCLYRVFPFCIIQKFLIAKIIDKTLLLYTDSSDDDDIDVLNTDSVSSDDHAIQDKGNLVLELHDIRREGAIANLQEPKAKKFRKKKQSKPKSKTGQSSSRSSEGSFPLQNADGREEFYDAHESYHGLAGSSKHIFKDSYIYTIKFIKFHRTASNYEYPDSLQFYYNKITINHVLVISIYFHQQTKQNL